MVERLVLAEIPAIEVRKGGKVFHVGEIPAFNLIGLMETVTAEGISAEGLNRVYSILFGKSAESAKDTFTLSDLRAIAQAVAKREQGPLAEEPPTEASSLPNSEESS